GLERTPVASGRRRRRRAARPRARPKMGRATARVACPHRDRPRPPQLPARARPAAVTALVIAARPPPTGRVRNAARACILHLGNPYDISHAPRTGGAGAYQNG